MSRVDGYLLLRKPIDVTSFQALSPVKKLFPGTKVGHTGTLDRFAEGLLVVLCGRMTRLTPLLTGLGKEYEAEIRFGRETDTLDPEGEIVAEGRVPGPSDMVTAIESFVGKIEQIPPQYSAVHVDGERAYRAARAGRTVTIAPRQVEIQAIDVREIEPPVARVRVVCSSGTYIRALARDIGRTCGSFAYLTKLVRTRIGPFNLHEAVTATELDVRNDLHTWEECFRRLSDIREARLKPDAVGRVSSGGRVGDRDFAEAPPDGRVAAYDPEGDFLALLQRHEGRYRYEFVASRQGH